MKRRIVSTVLILALIWLCSSTYAEEQARLWFDVNNDVEEYTVSVHISGNTGIEMLQFCLRYDYEKLELKAVSAGDAFRGITAPTISINTLGRVYLVWDALKPLPGGCLLILRFALKDGAAGNALFFYDGDFETIAADGAFNRIALNTERLEIPLGAKAESPEDSLDSKSTPEIEATVEPGATSEPEAAIAVPETTPTQDVSPEPSSLPEQESTMWPGDASGPETAITPKPSVANMTEKSSSQQTDSQEPVEIVIFVGEERAVEAGPQPEILWSSDDESIASVEDGVVVGKAAGIVEIKGEANDGSWAETYFVRVIEPDESSSVEAEQEGEEAVASRTLAVAIGLLAMVMLVVALLWVIIRERKQMWGKRSK